MQLHHVTPHTPQVYGEGFAPDNPTQESSPEFQVIGSAVAHETGSVALQNFILHGENPPVRPVDEPHDLRIIEDAAEKPLITH